MCPARCVTSTSANTPEWICVLVPYDAVMEAYEREFLAQTLEHRSASIANGLRDGLPDDEAIEGREQLSPVGRNWVRGYLTCQLSMVRGASTGNPNLSTADFEVISDLVDGKQKQIAAELYS